MTLPSARLSPRASLTTRRKPRRYEDSCMSCAGARRAMHSCRPRQVCLSSFHPTSTPRKIVDGALMDRRIWLDPLEISALFAGYGIPMVSSILAANPDEAASQAAEFIGAGLPVALKILSQDIQHKSDIGGLRLNLTTATAVRSATAEILNRVRAMSDYALSEYPERTNTSLPTVLPRNRLHIDCQSHAAAT